LEYETLANEFIALAKEMHNGIHMDIAQANKGEGFILCYLVKNEGRAYPSELARTAGISSARIAAALNALEAKGLVRRSEAGSDRRRKLITITEAGMNEAAKKREEIYQNTLELLEALGLEDAKELLRIITRIVAMKKVRCSYAETVKTIE
jgi:DNA-binding MarR family transcriptional regulator